MGSRSLVLIVGLVAAAGLSSMMAKPVRAADYYVATTGNDGSNGSIQSPWKTISYGINHLHTGDTLWIRGGTYKNKSISLDASKSGTSSSPIRVKGYPNETAVLSNGEVIYLNGVSWWRFENLVFDNQVDQTFKLGLDQGLGDSATVTAANIVFDNCEFRNNQMGSPIFIKNANQILIQNSYFHDNRTGVPFSQTGREFNAIDIMYKGDNIQILNSQFENNGSDGVQVGAWSYKAGAAIGKVVIQNNRFWVERPYHGVLGNVGENGVDVKGFGNLSGPVLIKNNYIAGFRPTTSDQDASGSCGEGILVHNSARNVIIDGNIFDDNTKHLVVFKHNGTAAVNDVTIQNNVFKRGKIFYQSGCGNGGIGLETSDVENLQVFHNTFYDNDRYLSSGTVVNAKWINNLISGGTGTTSSAWTASYNFWSQSQSSVLSTLQGTGSRYAVADFQLDADLHPLLGSPVIDAGTPLGVTTDLVGEPRDSHPDIGAYEYVVEGPMVSKYVASQMPFRFVVDGNLTEINSSSPSIHLKQPDTGTEGDFWLFWDSEGLYLGAQVIDGQLNAVTTDRDGQIWNDDSIELMLDTANNGGGALLADDYKFYLNVLNVQGESQSWDLTWPTQGGFESAVQVMGTVNNNTDIDDGYTMEMRIPWTYLGGVPIPTTGQVWGFDLVLDDRDASSVRHTVTWSNSNGGILNDPDGWGDIEFSKESAGVNWMGMARLLLKNWLTGLGDQNGDGKVNSWDWGKVISNL